MGGVLFPWISGEYHGNCVRFSATILLFFVFPLLLPGAWGGQIVNDAPRPRVVVPKAGSLPALTADATDPAWKAAAQLAPFTLSLPWRPQAPRVPPETEVRLLWDADALYVRFLCKDDHIDTPIHGHDAPIYQGDAVEIFLDPVGDSRQWIELEFNATNDVLDQLFLCTGEPRTDSSLRLTDEVLSRDVWAILSWDMHGLKSAAGRWSVGGKEIGWIVDVSIPAPELLKRTGLRHFRPMTLRGDFLRYKWLPGLPKRELISSNWSPVGFGCPHQSPAAYGEIVLEEAPAPVGSGAKPSSVNRP